MFRASTDLDSRGFGGLKMPMSAISPAARLLLDAHRSGRLIDEVPEDIVPKSVEAAYAVQTEVATVLGPVGGWKVTPMTDKEPRCSPILVSAIFDSPALLPLDVWANAEFELEIAVRLGASLPGRSTNYEHREIAAAIESVHIAFEVLNSRFAVRKSAAPMMTLADRQSTGCIVLGAPARFDNSPDFANIEMNLLVDGKEAGSAAGTASTRNALEAIAWLAQHASARGLPLKAGDTIITGARLGPIPGRCSAEGRGAYLGEVRASRG